MSRLVFVSMLALWSGATLLLSTTRRINRTPLAERIAPYTPGGASLGARSGLLSVQSFREVIAPLCGSVGERLARVFGISEDLSIRLARIHSPLDPSSFRVRQVGWTSAAFGAAFLVAIATTAPPLVGLILVLAGPLLTFLLLEQQVASASRRRQDRIFLELPVVTEQLGMLLASGYSLGGALNRIGDRGNGAISQDLRRVQARIRQGLSDVEALEEWAGIAEVPELGRLIGVLALNQEAGDLGHLIAEEARTIRREAQRRLIADIEKRSQQVWIPVTVATLVPGVMFMSVPFISALEVWTGGGGAP